MENSYTSPQMEVIEIEIEGAILNDSPNLEGSAVDDLFNQLP